MIVMKFGGTSIADSQKIARVIDIIKSKPNKKIVVVSAIAKATNTLTRLFVLASKNRFEQYQKELQQFKKRHEKITKELLLDRKLLTETLTKIDSLFTELSKTLESANKTPDSYEQNMAKTLAYGELLSSAIFHAAMLERNHKSTLIDARKIIITNNNHLKGTPLLEEITKITPTILNEHLNIEPTIITQGFIASTPQGETTLLGFEGSDLSASLIGMAMNASEIQIWTDVDGIMTADPKKIKNAEPIPHLSFKEAALLSSLGAKVIHPLTIEPAAQKNIPLRILNSFKPQHQGTLITDNSPQANYSITYQENFEHQTLIGIIGDRKKILENITKVLVDFTIKIIEDKSSNSNVVLAMPKKDLMPAIQKIHDALI